MDKEVSTKDGFADLVTQTDTNVEKMIIEFLHERFPSHRYSVSIVIVINAELQN